METDQRNKLNEAFRNKLKSIIEIYTRDLSEWLENPDSQLTIKEFIDIWVDSNAISE